MGRKRVLGIVLVSALIALCVLLYFALRPRPVRVAMINMPDFQLTPMYLSVDAKNVELCPVEGTERLYAYDAVLAFGMGLKWNDEDRERVKALDARRIPYIVMMTTTPDNNLCNLDTAQREKLLTYLMNGGTSNYRSGFNYLRDSIIGKSLREGEILPPIEYAADMLFSRHGEDLSFTSVADYQKHYESHGYRADAPRVAFIAGFADPFIANRDHFDAIIDALEQLGLNVYPISAGAKRVEFLREIEPDAVVLLPHGRFLPGRSDESLEFLRERNIPLLAPLMINTLYDDWMRDPKGMFGGFMSQSVVMPEVDGAIVPFSLVALESLPNGLTVFRAIPDRLPVFALLVRNYIDLKSKPNSQKRLAIYYFKGPGQNALVAQGLEAVPSLYNLLLSLRSDGYNVDGLPATLEEFTEILMTQGPIFNSYAEGNQSRFLMSDYPARVHEDSLQSWLQCTFTPAQVDSLRGRYGDVPGEHNVVIQDGAKYMAVTRIEFGNIALLPQPAQGVGENTFQMVHGSTPVPAYPFLASYLWVRNAFKADVLMHFGTHGSLEFVPGKQVALSSDDYADRLVYDMPHLYYYTTANVGESMMAKRRSYAQLVSYLAPPFIETDLEGGVRTILEMTDKYLSGEEDDARLGKLIKREIVGHGYHRDLKIDSVLEISLARHEVEMVADYVQELASAKITGGMYTTGVPFEENKIKSSVFLLTVDPVAYALSQVDLQRGKVTDQQLRSRAFFDSRYLRKAEKIVSSLQGRGVIDGVAQLPKCGIKADELAILRAVEEFEREEKRLRSGKMGGMMGGGRDASQPDSVSPSASERETAKVLRILAESLEKISYYERMLRESPARELAAFQNALAGGYTAPSPGGDYIASPSVLPTGRNLYAIDPERTPTLQAWEHGKQLGDELIADYRRRHDGAYPQKVSFTLWSSSFIESEGTTIAEILYLLGVEPVRDRMGRVQDVRLIPMEELQRPRLDVIVQTSGQLRDLAASRLFLIQKAVELVASTIEEDDLQNFVHRGVRDAERHLLDQGLTPLEARRLSTARVFGGLNGSYGTNIQAMVEAGDRWEERSEIATTYLHNMGAFYGSDISWGSFTAGAFEAALQNTDAVVQPRQSNTWGPLSLDHVYEFMGGLTLAVHHVTGKDPEGYFSDLRNRHRVKTQEVKQSIGIEARTTILNPTFVKEQLREGAGAAAAIDETIRNTYAWNVMKPSAIDHELWDAIYDMYVQDTKQLGVVEFFERVNPAALQDYTAAMLETVRKGMWKATPEQIEQIAMLHTQSVSKAGTGCSEMVCDNALLRDFVASKVTPERAQEYKKKISDTRTQSDVSAENAKVLKRESSDAPVAQSEGLTETLPWVLGAAALVLIVLIINAQRAKRRGRRG